MSERPPGYYENALWGYTDASSYAPGDTVTLFVSSPVSDVECRVVRVGAEEVKVYEQGGIRAGHHDVPECAYRDGCRWPETFAFSVGTEWPSGYYRVQLRAGEHSAEHFLVVRAANPGVEARHVLVLATNTYQAYNSWGGRNLYGDDASLGDNPDQLVNRPTPTPIVAWDRPYSRCLLASPVPTRLVSSSRRGMGEPLGLPDAVQALAEEASIWDMPAGFVNKWEQQFVAWAERTGITIDYLVQSDLDDDPNALDPYPSYLSVGHDEYWTWEERDAVEAFVDAGGRAAFFSGNTSYWQVRFEREGQAMVGYKFTATSDDPVLGTDREERLTSLWSDPLIGRPETHMTGVTFSRGGYARTGYAISRGTGGYTIYRPEHWSVAGTDLFYGDVIGDESTLIGYETDGCAFRFEDGLPVPTGEDGAPEGFEIVGVAPASLGEAELLPAAGLLGRDDAVFVASRLFDGDTERALRGHATLGSFRRGGGEVFTADHRVGVGARRAGSLHRPDYAKRAGTCRGGWLRIVDQETKNLIKRRERILGTGAPLFYEQPLHIVRGDGVFLFDANGKRYVDMYNNVPCVGHANPHVVEAMQRQAATLNVHSRYLHEGLLDYAERLVAKHDASLDRVVFTCTGTEANEVAISMARLATEGRGIICTDRAYHGNSALVSKLTWAGGRSDPEIRSVRFPQTYRPIEDDLSEAELADRYLSEVEAAIESFAAEGVPLAGMLVCSLLANEGLPDIPKGYMARAATLVRAAGGLFIADEVQAGFCRSGHWWGYETTDFVPDIATLGKPMGNGFPLAGVVARGEVVDRFRKGSGYFNTFAASPLQAAVGSAVLDVIESEKLEQRVAEVGTCLRDDLGKIECEAMGDVRGSGLFIGLDWVSDRETKAPDPKGAIRVVNRLKDKGFLTSNAGALFNVIKLRPPLVFEPQHAGSFLNAFEETVRELY